MPKTRLQTKGSFTSDLFGLIERFPVTLARPPGAPDEHGKNASTKTRQPSTGKCGATHNRRLLDEIN